MNEHTCDECGEPMYAYESWTLAPGVPPHGPASDGDYIHERCA